MAALYPPASNHLEPAEALALPHVEFFGAFASGQLAACGGYKRMQDDGHYGEIKRLFVDPAFRGLGLARLIMDHIEQHARRAGLGVLRLETGVYQPEALGLYRDLGYAPRAAFGAYRPDPLSIFMEKTLGGA